MTASAFQKYDIAIVGAGTAGSICAIKSARNGARVALLEANPKANRRLAGEWLHPPAVRILRDLDIEIESTDQCTPGKGFVVIPEDGSGAIMLPYLNESQGLALEHSTLIERLHEKVRSESNIDFIMPARVRTVQDRQLAYAVNGSINYINADRIVGADGRTSVVRKSLGLSTSLETCSRMVGTIVEGVELPQKGFGHVLLGGPGPILMYELADGRIRIIVDVPLDHWVPRDRISMIAESYASLLPEQIRTKYVDSLHHGKFHVAANELKPRITYGSSERVLIGDAVGHYHPLTAVGMTLGLGDAVELADCKSFDEFQEWRLQEIRAPEFLAMGLYEVFSDYRMESAVFRKMIYEYWRSNPADRDKTVSLLACESTSVPQLSLSFSYIVLKAIKFHLFQPLDRLSWRRLRDFCSALTVRLSWLIRGAREQHKLKKSNRTDDTLLRSLLGKAFLVSMPPRVSNPTANSQLDVHSVNVDSALQIATERLISYQAEDGSWEGEMVWCPMLTAQYVLLHWIIGRKFSPQRRQRILRQFELTRIQGGLWGMHEHASPSLFVTTLVYVAARLLGIERDSALVVPAREFIQAEDVLNIPSWGKFWLAVMNLYDWRGMNAVLPELWKLPRRFAIHPSNWYCHTRLIYMAMANIYATRFQVPVSPEIESLRTELYPQGYANVNFSAARNRLRKADLFLKPSVWVRCAYVIARLFERYHDPKLRERCTDELVQRIKWELQTTSHTSISPVSGMLNIIAIWLNSPQDPDFELALAQMEGWIWEDDEQGVRVTGARSASWDTGFSLQALATVPTLNGVQSALRSGTEFLCDQQIGHSFDGFHDAYRTDPEGGWCFAGGWHGWPVTDCTAEAVLGIISAKGSTADPTELGKAVQFMLRGQNRDGGFGSYEARRSRMSLEWLNPAEMFGESMTEFSFVECTASCLSALAACRDHFPELANQTVTTSIERGAVWLRRSQFSDGSWRGVWGVQYIYGTLFGIRGLMAAGATPGDPAVRLACHWLLTHQRSDGGWGEHHGGCFSGQYVAHTQSQIIQTAWALIALLEAGDSNWSAISHGIQFLIKSQNADGTWPKQDMAGVFFRTALLDYVLYRQYFPIHAMGLYAQRNQSRQQLAKGRSGVKESN